MIKKEQNIRLLTLEEIQESLIKMEEKSFRGKQIFEWLWQKDAQQFGDMSNLSIALRDKLETLFLHRSYSIAGSADQFVQDNKVRVQYRRGKSN